MSTSTHTHRSMAYVKPIDARGRAWKPDPITSQFRFIVRMAYACHERQVPYVLTWGLADGVMSATIMASGQIPTPKPLPKEPKLPYKQAPKASRRRAVTRQTSAPAKAVLRN